MNHLRRSGGRIPATMSKEHVMNLKISIIIGLMTVFTLIPFSVNAEESDSGIELEDGISVDDTLSPEINYSYIKRFAIQKARVLGNTGDVEDVQGVYDDYSRTSGIGNLNLGPGVTVEGDVYIVIEADTLNAIDTD